MTEPAKPELGQVTVLLARMNAGDADAIDRLFPLVYGELRQAAERALRGEREGHTLQPTALVHEAFLKLAGGGPTGSRDRAHFVGIAARAMRQILVDHARRRGAAKRGGGVAAEPIDSRHADPNAPFEDLVALDDALDRLSALSPRLRSVVELRFFAGLTDDEIAETLEVTSRTVQRDWAKARAWLYREMYGSRGGGGDV